MRIALDVMGGDHGFGVVIEGVKQALAADDKITAVHLVGNEELIRGALAKFHLTDSRVHVLHASEVLTMDDAPLEGIRKKKDSSLVRAIELVRYKKADAVISPGNTGALVAGSMKLGRLDGVERPAIACRFPSRTQDFILLDAGANSVCEPSHLAQFAVMGSVYARGILGLKNPRVGVLSNGTEESKGNDLTRESARLCSQLDLNFIGYVEGFDLFNDAVDVVVCDGFVGNIVLKTAESLSRAIGHILKTQIASHPVRKIGALLAKGAFDGLKRRVDPEVYGGAAILGLNGIVIKAHGSARARAIASAVRVAAEEVGHGINATLAQDIARANKMMAAATATKQTAPSMTPAPNPNFTNPRAKHGFKGRTCSVAGVGAYVPERILTNADLEKSVETSDEWITTRTGIKERRIAAENEFTSDLATQAALRAMKMAGVTGEQIDLIILATITPDMVFPSTACLVQQKIGATRAAAFDMEAACSGFIYGLEIGQQFIMSRTYDTVLVIGAEKLSSIVDWTDRNTCVLFGDGAGAAILQSRPGAHGLLTAVMGADGSKADLLYMPGGGSRCPATQKSIDARLHYLRMEGKDTFKNAVQAMCSAAKEALRRCDVDVTKLKCIIPHQANRRIIDAVGERLGATPEQMFVNLDRYGNTSAASVAIALDEAVSSGRIERGDLILLVVFGAGLTWGAAVIEW